MKKETKKINGVELSSLCLGQRAIIRKGDHWYSTSPVVHYVVAGGEVSIETKNSVYQTK